MIVEVWVIITGKGDRPYFQGKRPRRELIEKWHHEEDGVRVIHVAVNVDSGESTVFQEPTPADQERWAALHEPPDTDPDDSRQLRELRQAIEQHLGWWDAESEENGDYIARIVEVGRKLGPFKPTRPIDPEADPELDADGLPKPHYCSERHRMTRCQDIDGYCAWKGCPQKAAGEPAATGRHCPLDGDEFEVEL
jgi:hypothetical protein